MVVNNISLMETEMAACTQEIMEGKATDAQIGAFLTALRIKGETVEEITGAARIMRQKAATIKAPEGVLDTCGTGGDMAHTFNISTTTAFVVAGAGVPAGQSTVCRFIVYFRRRLEEGILSAMRSTALTNRVARTRT